MKNLNKLTALIGVASIAFIASPVAAQSAEETINIGLEVTIAAEDPVISGLQDVSLTWTEDPTSSASVSDLQTFCIFTPFQFFTMTATSFHSADVGGKFGLLNDLAPDPDIAHLVYNIALRDAFSGTDATLGSFVSGVAVNGIDSDLFNTDATCSDGENISLEISIIGSDIVESGTTNSDILEQFVDGITRNFSDQLTILIETEI